MSEQWWELGVLVGADLVIVTGQTRSRAKARRHTETLRDDGNVNASREVWTVGGGWDGERYAVGQWDTAGRED